MHLCEQSVITVKRPAFLWCLTQSTEFLSNLVPSFITRGRIISSFHVPGNLSDVTMNKPKSSIFEIMLLPLRKQLRNTVGTKFPKKPDNVGAKNQNKNYFPFFPVNCTPLVKMEFIRYSGIPSNIQNDQILIFLSTKKCFTKIYSCNHSKGSSSNISSNINIFKLKSVNTRQPEL